MRAVVVFSVVLVAVLAAASTAHATEPTVKAIASTAFGSTLLQQIKSLQGYPNVQKYVAVVKERIVSEQKSENAAYATFSNMCNSSLSQLEAIVKAKVCVCG